MTFIVLSSPAPPSGVSRPLQINEESYLCSTSGLDYSPVNQTELPPMKKTILRIAIVLVVLLVVAVAASFFFLGSIIKKGPDLQPVWV